MKDNNEQPATPVIRRCKEDEERRRMRQLPTRVRKLTPEEEEAQRKRRQLPAKPLPCTPIED